MRIAVVSDIHGNRTAFEAVLTDLKLTSPDVVFHGGDLAHAGSSPVEIVDSVRELGWQGVVGNTDEMLYRPEGLREFAKGAPHLQAMWDVIEEMAEATRAALGKDRLAWLADLPRSQVCGPMVLVHASPESLWRAPGPKASDAELELVYGPLGREVAVYAHIHCGFVRRIAGDPSISERMVVNTGSVSLSYDGDGRASYLLLDASEPAAVPTLRRVEYDLERETRALALCGLPHSDWIARTLESARPQMP
jgi:predicted phosphodiesterase